MANPFKQLHIKSAVKGSSSFDLSCHHLTTMDFGQIVPIFVQHEVMPGDKFNVKQNIFSRISPLAVPTYGNLWLKTATFFVPYHQIAYDAESFLAGDKYINGQLTHIRSFRYSTFVAFFLHYGLPSQDWFFNQFHPSQSTWAKAKDSELMKVVPMEELDSFDLQIRTNTPFGSIAFKFTQLGRYFYKIFRSLGYGFFEGNAAIDNTNELNFWHLELNAMPLLSFFKAYNDWMSQSARYNLSILSSELQSIRYSTTPYTGDQWYNSLYHMFSNLYLQYEPNYFTTAWQCPNQIIYGEDYNVHKDSPSLGLQDLVPSDLAETINLDSNANETELLDSNSLGAIGLRFLTAFDKFLRRNNYSGARSVERLLSRFGIKTEDYRNEFAILLDTSKSLLQIGDVTNQTDTGDESRPLGSYAGKGIVSGDNKFDFHSSDFGTIITVCYLQPDVQYYQGIDRTILKKAVADFYQPEYDSLDASPIAQCELSQNSRNGSINFNHPISVFGFTERYNELRHGRSRVTGDFALDYDLHCWHFGMEQSYLEGINAKAQSSQIISQPQNNNQFDRIFVDETDEAEDMRDHFYMTCYFDVNAHRNMLNISEVANLGEGSLNIQRNGTQLS